MGETRWTAAVIGVGDAGRRADKSGGHAIGHTHGQAFQRHADVDLVAAADPNADNLAAFQETFGVPHGYPSAEAMLADRVPDLVSIGTYVGLHYPLIEVCAQAGVQGILCEKPFLAKPTEIAKLRALTEATGVKVVVAHIRRYGPGFQRARELFNDGTVGDPVMCLAGIEGWDLSEWGSHWLDMFRFFHGDRPLKWVMGQARVRDARGFGHAMEEHAAAYFAFEGGGKGLLDGGVALDGGELMRLVGTAGSVRMTSETDLQIINADGLREESFEGDWLAQWDALLNDLVAWVDGGDAPMTGHPNMLHSAELNLGAYLSAVRGDRVDLPLSAEDLAVDEWPLEIAQRRWED